MKFSIEIFADGADSRLPVDWKGVVEADDWPGALDAVPEDVVPPVMSSDEMPEDLRQVRIQVTRVG